MQVLTAHRERVVHLRDALDQLVALHEEQYRQRNEIASLMEGNRPDRAEAIDSLHESALVLAERILAMRVENFGEVSREAQLELTSMVESAWELTRSRPPDPSAAQVAAAFSISRGRLTAAHARQAAPATVGRKKPPEMRGLPESYAGARGGSRR